MRSRGKHEVMNYLIYHMLCCAVLWMVHYVMDHSSSSVGCSWCQISRVVTSELSRLYGLEASPEMLAIAAVAYWRAGVVTGACRFLDKMGVRELMNILNLTYSTQM